MASSPPAISRNTIARDQLDPKQLDRLAAQRKLYTDAKTSYIVQTLLSMPGVGVVALASLWIPSLADALPLLGLALLLMDLLLATPSQRSLREQAARIQEAFDCDVLQLEWRELKAGRRPTVEAVTQHAERFRHAGGDMTLLRDWYPLGVATLPMPLARLVCQRTNSWWDATQRRRYAWWGVAGTLAVAALLLVVTLVRGLTHDRVMLQVVAPLSPALLTGLRLFRENIAAARRADRRKVQADDLWERALRGEIVGAALDLASRDLQDRIFDHRRQSPSTLDWVYRKLRSEHEAQMNKNADALVEEATHALSSGKVVVAALPAGVATASGAIAVSSLPEGSPMNALFTWIHLSDIHIGHGGASHEADQELVLGALRKDVEERSKVGVPQPDAILVTGDIAFSGGCVASDEYARASRWLHSIAAAASLSPDKVFLVPGNHDVQRTVDKPTMAMATLKGLRRNDPDIDAALKDGQTRNHLVTRQGNYFAFVESFAPACRADSATGQPRLYWQGWVETRDGPRVRLVGLNTALLAADEKVFGTDRGCLRLGKRQIADVLTSPPIGPQEVVIVMTHHPFLEGWLSDQKEMKAWVQNHAHVHLSGHVHESENQHVRSGSGTDIVSVVAGAVHGEPEADNIPPRHGYSFGALIVDGGKLKVRIWPRKWSPGNTGFRRDVEVADETTGYATHELSLALPSAPESTGSM